jgi:hypothetical protein
LQWVKTFNCLQIGKLCDTSRLFIWTENQFQTSNQWKGCLITRLTMQKFVCIEIIECWMGDLRHCDASTTITKTVSLIFPFQAHSHRQEHTSINSNYRTIFTSLAENSISFPVHFTWNGENMWSENVWLLINLLS